MSAAGNALKEIIAERDAMRAELDALRELLREARGWVIGKDYDLIARIDAALNKGGGDE